MQLTELEIIEAQEFYNNYGYKVQTGEWTKEFFNQYFWEYVADLREQSARLQETLERAQRRWQELAYRKA